MQPVCAAPGVMMASLVLEGLALGVEGAEQDERPMAEFVRHVPWTGGSLRDFEVSAPSEEEEDSVKNEDPQHSRPWWALGHTGPD